MELRKVLYLLLVVYYKEHNSEQPMGRMSRARYREGAQNFLPSLGTPPSQKLHVFANQEAV